VKRGEIAKPKTRCSNGKKKKNRERNHYNQTEIEPWETWGGQQQIKQVRPNAKVSQGKEVKRCGGQDFSTGVSPPKGSWESKAPGSPQKKTIGQKSGVEGENSRAC